MAQIGLQVGNDKFISAPAHGVVARAAAIAQDIRYLRQDPIARLVAVQVVDRFQIVQVDHHQHHSRGCGVTFRSRGNRRAHELCEHLLQIAPVAEPRERVGETGFLELQVEIFELPIALGELERAVPYLHLQALRVFRLAPQFALLDGPQPVDHQRREQPIDYARPPGCPRRGRYPHGKRQSRIAPGSITVGRAHAERVVTGGQVRIRHAALGTRFHPGAVKSLQHVPVAIVIRGSEIESGKLERYHRVLVAQGDRL